MGKPRALEPPVERDILMIARAALYNVRQYAQPYRVER